MDCLPSDACKALGIYDGFFTPVPENSDIRVKSYFQDSCVRLRKPCQNHLTGLYFLDLIVIRFEYLQSFLIIAIEDK
jgi:hypothetical protein